MCGIFGVWGNDYASKITFEGLKALQHRGQESAGISSNSPFLTFKNTGKVTEALSKKDINQLTGNIAIGHVRYSTSGGGTALNAQPFRKTINGEPIAVVHNGNITNLPEIKKRLYVTDIVTYPWYTKSDTEYILDLIQEVKGYSLEEKIYNSLKYLDGAFSLLVMTKNSLFAIRDKNAFRPLILGKLHDAFVFASETTALDRVGAIFMREIEPGEMFSITPSHPAGKSRIFDEVTKERRCIFESVYFSRPDSISLGQSSYQARKLMGEYLAKEHPAIFADMVIPVPDSGIPAAIGFSQQSMLPYEMGLIRNRYSGRTFIEPTQEKRINSIKAKLSVNKKIVKDKSIVVVDDSIVRGSTSKKIVELLREAGAKEIHFRVASPPTKHPCFYGIDTPDREELIASSHTVAEIADIIKADTLGYLTLSSLEKSVKQGRDRHCKACFTGCYPVKNLNK